MQPDNESRLFRMELWDDEEEIGVEEGWGEYSTTICALCLSG
jgi:hypothetical protein